jgi:hypothetical protein
MADLEHKHTGVQRRSLPVVCLMALAIAACGDSSSPDSRGSGLPSTPVYRSYTREPEPPVILRDVAMINDQVELTHPFVPGHRTTMDGRVALRVQGGPPGTEQLSTMLSFFLFAPEKLGEPIMSGPPGAKILADSQPFDVVFPPALDPQVMRLGHHAICDATEPFPAAGERPNPYACGPDGTHDCYDITVISSTSNNIHARLWGTPATVEVSNPKTAAARIVNVELGTPVSGALIRQSSEWTEPAVTRDGRLLTGRWGRFPRLWKNPNTGESLRRPYDLAYSQLPDDAEPCDVRGWTEFHPMSHAPYDPRMVGRYGLAAYPFRDSEGNLIPDGEDLGGTYPWVDREGTNVFMAAVPGRIVEQSHTRYPRRCVTEGCESYEENIDWDRGFMAAGLWTHGKFVHLDAMINNMDWAVGVTPKAHFLVDLYRHANGADVAVRFGSGRFIDAVRYAGGPYPPGYTHNANILDSLQNLLNYDPNAHPVTPRDVVWTMSTGVATDEIAFDDFVDPNAFIVSNMQASITQLYLEDGASTSFPVYWNGQVRTIDAPYLPLPELYILHPEEDAEIHVQNAATSLRWQVPAYGLVEAGSGRIEPVALGGIQGKGFWLSGENEIRYAVPPQPRSVREQDWYIGVFVDPRSDAGEERVLARFPDGSAIRVAGHRWVRYVSGGEVVREIGLPAASGWRHLAWRLRDGNRSVTLLADGFAIDRWQSATPLFEMVEGDFVVGQRAQDLSGFRGFRGWIDELIVLAHDVNPEVACNHARGTLVRVAANPEWSAKAQLFPAWAHDQIATAAGEPAGGRYACFHDYRADYAAHLGNLPSGTVSVRARINFPEGPLRAGMPRPDSSRNAFCLSCHRSDGKGGMSLQALAYLGDVPAEHDRRRQPMQPPRRVFGNIPANWIAAGDGPGSPPERTQAPDEGLLIDHWVLPGR